MRERAGLSFLPAELAASLPQEEAGSGAWQDWLYSPSLALCSLLTGSSLMSTVFFFFFKDNSSPHPHEDFSSDWEGVGDYPKSEAGSKASLLAY